jgi:TolB protein
MGDFGPRWSPNGQWIAFQRNGPDSRRDIWITTADGATEMNISDHPAYDNEPAWSPDGTRILLNSGRAGTGTDLYIWDGATGQITQLTFLGDTLLPDWSPDGTRIAFTRFMGEPGKYEVFVMNTDATDLVQVTANGGDSEHPRWSPDGSKLLFTSDHEPPGYGIYTINPDGSGQTRLSPPGSFDLNPAWSPDGTMIVFDELGGQGLFTMAADGGSRTPVGGSDVSDTSPDWQRLGMLGDTDCDTESGLADAIPVLSFMAGLLPLAPCLAFGNLDCNLRLDAADVLIQLRAEARVPHATAVAECSNVTGGGTPSPAVRRFTSPAIGAIITAHEGGIPWS